MADDSKVAGMDEEGLRRALGELLASNRATQANFDEIRQQFPIQPSNLSDEVPSWGELEEGGLVTRNEDGEIEPGEAFEEGAAAVALVADNTTEGRATKSVGGEEGTTGKWVSVAREFTYDLEAGILAFGSVPVLAKDHTELVSVEWRLTNVGATKAIQSSYLVPGARELSLIYRPIHITAVRHGTQADQLFGFLSPELWQIEEPLSLRVQVRAGNLNTIIPEGPKPFLVVKV